ncbi:hypothetical protein BJP32_16730, partial [Brevundimonas sp. ZS04]
MGVLLAGWRILVPVAALGLAFLAIAGLLEAAALAGARAAVASPIPRAVLPAGARVGPGRVDMDGFDRNLIERIAARLD